ncbi:flagellin [Azospirillum sp. SYSU D00513]|uniref:flagellin n=1 Tax=Azospirillum sp. SYSU D00513 TaxID=2812561 RepID=UPI001A973883|nr:flagellin [Azospirillum sp. SYSU D00513]
MTSILTNTNATTALQVLSSTNRNLSEVQAQISTGKKVANAKDNASTWAVSQIMSADVAGFKTLNENLGLAESAVSVARTAAESTTDLLKQMKEKIVGAQDGTQDRQKIQDDITELKNQIKAVTSAAQFNGLNYMEGDKNQKVLASLDRSSNGDGTYDVASNFITFQSQNLVIGAAAPTTEKVIDAGNTAKAAVASTVDLDILLDPTVGNNGQLTLKVGNVDADSDLATAGNQTINLTTAATGSLADAAAVIQTALNAQFTGITAAVVDGKIRITDANGRGITGVTHTGGTGQATLRGTQTVAAGSVAVSATASQTSYTIDAFKTGSGTNYAAGDFSKITLTKADGTTASVDVSASATMGAVATDLAAGLGAGYTAAWDANKGELTVKDAQGRGVDLSFEGNKAGKLADLATLSILTDTAAADALKNIETMIQSSIDSAAKLGSVEKRLGIQTEFLSKLSDSLTAGIGTLVDADITAASARLQALQVQQQLGTQALSIANQGPQQLMSLFR